MILNSRRKFLKTAFLSSVVLVISSGKLFGAVTPLKILLVVQEDLFPLSKTIESNSYAYLSMVLRHSRISDEDKQFLRNGVRWLNEEAVSKYKKIYTELSDEKRQDILKIISKERWGENWIDTVLTYIMESMLGDPIYGINKNGAGWKWLKHESGLPRPKKALL